MNFLLAAAVNTGNPPVGLQTGAMDLVMQSGPIAKFILLILLATSVFSWAIIFTKHKAIKLAKKQSQAFLNAFWYGQDLEEIFTKVDQYPASPVAAVFKSGFKELKKLTQLESKPDLLRNEGVGNISRALIRASMTEVGNLEKSVGFLATIASATPFIGLFGTVWGIMNSFQGIGATGSANLAVVAPGISEALIATAAGLGAAIPAVISYNYFIGRIRVLTSEMDMFSQDFLNIVNRSLLKG